MMINWIVKIEIGSAIYCQQTCPTMRYTTYMLCPIKWKSKQHCTKNLRLARKYHPRLDLWWHTALSKCKLGLLANYCQQTLLSWRKGHVESHQWKSGQWCTQNLTLTKKYRPRLNLWWQTALSKCKLGRAANYCRSNLFQHLEIYEIWEKVHAMQMQSCHMWWIATFCHSDDNRGVIWSS